MKNKVFLTFIFALLLFASEAQNIRHDQLKEPQAETSDSLIFYMHDAEGYWRLGKGILDTSMVRYIEAYATIEQLNDSVVVLRGEIPTLLTELDSTGFRVNYGQLLNVPAFLTSETDPVYSNDSAYIKSHIRADLDTDPTNEIQDISGIATNQQAIIDTASNIRADIPTNLTDLDSTWFTVDTSQVRDLQTFVENNSAEVSGTRGYLSKFGVSGLTESVVFEDAIGNVGIGKTPEYKLDVSGNINFDNNLYKNGVLIDFSSLFDTVQVGDIYGGGMVFYMDPSKKWGLTVATTALASLPAGLSNLVPAPTTSTGFGAGLDNTLNIVDHYGTSGNNYAALYCLNSNHSGFSDWYLPSIREADSIYVNLRATGKIAYMNDFWTSSVSSIGQAYYYFYYERYKGGSGNQSVGEKYNVYPIRKFTIDEAAADFSYPSGSGIVTVNGGNQWGTTITDNSNNWNTAYNDKINSLAVTGTTTKTITLTQQDGGTITGSFTDISGEGGGDYTLPEASSTVLGGVKIASNGGFLPSSLLVQADRYLTTDTPVSTDWIGFGDVSSGFNKKCTIAEIGRAHV